MKVKDAYCFTFGTIRPSLVRKISAFCWLPCKDNTLKVIVILSYLRIFGLAVRQAAQRI